MNSSFTAKIKTRTISKRRDTSKTAQIGAPGTDTYCPILGPISFCGQQGMCQTCGGKHAIALLALFYCHSNKQHIISWHIFWGGSIHAKTIQFDQHKSTSFMRTQIWNRMVRVGNFVKFKTLSWKTAKIPSKANNFQDVFISCHTLKVLKGVSLFHLNSLMDH